MSQRTEFDGIFDRIATFFNSPAIKASYAAEARRNAEKYKKDRAAEIARLTEEQEERDRKRSYDTWALNGGSDECTQFGINDGCKPHCPVFERGECEVQAENEELFAED